MPAQSLISSTVCRPYAVLLVEPTIPRRGGPLTLPAVSPFSVQAQELCQKRRQSTRRICTLTRRGGSCCRLRRERRGGRGRRRRSARRRQRRSPDWVVEEPEEIRGRRQHKAGVVRLERRLVGLERPVECEEVRVLAES